VRVNGSVPPLPRGDQQKELDKAVTMAAIPREICVAYIPKHNRGGEITIRGLRPGMHEATWFNPRSGTRARAGDRPLEHVDETGIWRVPPRPDDMDWVILLRATSPDAASRTRDDRGSHRSTGGGTGGISQEAKP
jgi:hypothetical protein